MSCVRPLQCPLRGSPVSAENPDGFAPTCSVVVCTRDRPTQLDQCLEAVARLVYPRFDVLVVDNAPGNARTREVRCAGVSATSSSLWSD
jgi:hypothetical protein